MTIDQGANWICDAKTDDLETGLGLLEDRVTTLENNPISTDWKLFASTDWSDLSDENGLAKQDLLLLISFIPKTSSSLSNYGIRIDLPILICKGYNFNQDGFVIQKLPFSTFGRSDNCIVSGKIYCNYATGHNMLTSQKINVIGNYMVFSLNNGQVTNEIITYNLQLTKGTNYQGDIQSDRVYIFTK